MCKDCTCQKREVCECESMLFCADRQSDVDAYDGDEVLAHVEAGHKLEPYGCEACQPALREA